MIVYRVELKNGAGPYRNGGKETKVAKYMSSVFNQYSHPLPCIDFPNDCIVSTLTNREEREETKKYRFGFSSIWQLKDWFCVQMSFLEQNGYFISVYEADEVYQTSRQVAFNFDTAILKNRIVPTKIETLVS